MAIWPTCITAPTAYKPLLAPGNNTLPSGVQQAVTKHQQALCSHLHQKNAKSCSGSSSKEDLNRRSSTSEAVVPQPLGSLSCQRPQPTGSEPAHCHYTLLPAHTVLQTAPEPPDKDTNSSSQAASHGGDTQLTFRRRECCTSSAACCLTPPGDALQHRTPAARPSPSTAPGGSRRPS